MDRKIFTVVLAIVLIASFFLPLYSAGGVSAFDIVKGPSYGNGIEVMLMKYLWILIPLSGLMLLIGAMNNDNYILGRGIWAWLPLLALLYIIIRPIIDGAKIGDMIKLFGVGMWVMLVASLILAFYNPRPRV
jgi:hypothetical protein